MFPGPVARMVAGPRRTGKGRFCDIASLAVVRAKAARALRAREAIQRWMTAFAATRGVRLSGQSTSMSVRQQFVHHVLRFGVRRDQLLSSIPFELTREIGKIEPCTGLDR